MLTTQRQCESLHDYIKRFIEACSDVKDLNDSFAMQAFKAEVVNDNIHYILYDDKIMTLYELLQKPQGFFQARKISEN